MRTESLIVESPLPPADLVDALRLSASAIERTPANPFWDVNATFEIAADGPTLSIVVLPHVRRFVPRFVGLVKESGTGSLVTGAVGPSPLARISWYVFVAGAIWVAASSLAFVRFQGETWAIALATAIIMSVLGTGFLALAHWILWGSTTRDRALIRTILASVGRIEDLDVSRARGTNAHAPGV